MAWPLNDLTCKYLEFTQSPECQQAFDVLKQKLFDTPVLTVFDPAVHNTVWYNTSNFTVGAVLVQRNMPDSLW